MKLLMCNLKSNKTMDEFYRYIDEVSKLDNKESLVIFPSNLYLTIMHNFDIDFGSQNISVYTDESSTGEVTASQVKSTNAKYTIIGHSERRTKFNEDDYLISKKIKIALEHGLKIVYCIGETKEEKLRHKTYQVLEKQIAKIFNNISELDMDNIIIAYEPVWAIGTGISAKPNEISEITRFIKKLILDYYEQSIKVLYGGSVNSDNISIFNNIETIDGFLVGKSSLNPEEINKMLQKIK